MYVMAEPDRTLLLVVVVVVVGKVVWGVQS